MKNQHPFIERYRRERWHPKAPVRTRLLALGALIVAAGLIYWGKTP